MRLSGKVQVRRFWKQKWWILRVAEIGSDGSLMLGELQQIFWPSRNQLKFGFTCEFHSETSYVNPCRGVFIPISPCYPEFVSASKSWTGFGGKEEAAWITSKARGLTCALKQYLDICMRGLHYFPNRRLNAQVPRCAAVAFPCNWNTQQEIRRLIINFK